LAQQGAVLAHGIAQGQYCLEGNKRTALAALATFLQVNGHDLIASQPERAEWMLALSEGLTTDWLAERIREAIDPSLG
jgi:death on curing protein